MPILNYTTQIDPAKSAAEIQCLLGSKGASSCSVAYANSEPVAVYFCLDVKGQPVNFQLPSNWQGVKRAIARDHKIPYKLKTDLQAKRVSWRIVKDWVEAQLAIIESGQAEMAEVFMPYAIGGNGKTLYQQLSSNPQLMLGAN